ncbi:unnamed protein product [Bursaphelenchus xylophilus]|nr:unnamed protein product [Bursaphelenchus xylophilus]CAG9124304.1 unnamed protein product [Bursaphelenchus xylophilus]
MEETEFSNVLTYTIPMFVVLILFCCMLKLYVKWTGGWKNCHRQRTLSENSSASTTVSINTDMVIHQPSGPNLPVIPFEITEFDGSAFFTVPFLLERFPPKYEDAIKLPSPLPPRRASVAVPLPPPPFYEGTSSNGSGFADAPPSYWTLPRLGTGNQSGSNDIYRNMTTSINMPATSSSCNMYSQLDTQKVQNSTGSTASLVRHAPLTQSLSDSVQLARTHEMGMVHRQSTASSPVQLIPPLPGAVVESPEGIHELRVDELEKN